MRGEPREGDVVREIDPLKGRIRDVLARRPAVGLAIGVVRDGSITFFHGHGVADVAAGEQVTEDTVFRVASITKTFTAIAVLQLWEEGIVDLDAPANEYLRAYRLVTARDDWRPATVRHLLTHTAGIGEVVPASGVLRRDFGESVRPGRPVPTLAAFYRGGLGLDGEPGTRFRYGNHSFATLGQLVEDVTGQSLGSYLREHLFVPLGMTDSGLTLSPGMRSRLATGYTLRSGGPRPVPPRDWVTVGAASAYSTPRDMGHYLAALLGGGANAHGAVLKPPTMASMYASQYRPDPRIPGIGLAFFRGDAGGHPTVEHQGILPGFDSQILLAPDDGVGLMAFSNGTRHGMLWLPTEMSGLLNLLLGVPDDSIRTDVPQRPEVWGHLCGWYHLPGPLTDARVRAMVGAGVEVSVRRGQLVLRALTPVPALLRGLPLHPDDDHDPYAFRIDLSTFGLSTLRVVFARDDQAGRTSMHLDVMPLTAHRRSAATNPHLWALGALGVAATVAAARHAASISAPSE